MLIQKHQCNDEQCRQFGGRDVADGITKVANAFSVVTGRDPINAFRSIYGINGDKKMVFQWGNCPECQGVGAYTYGARKIGFASMVGTWVPDSGWIRTNHVIHELGHAFNNRLWVVSSSRNYRLGEFELGNRQAQDPNFPDRSDGQDPGDYGFAGPFGAWGGWQPSTDGSPGEEFADMFIGWTYQRFSRDRWGEKRMIFMNEIMPTLIDYAISH